MTTHLVLVHGAWAGPWVWDSILDAVRSAGHHPHVVTLPGVGDLSGPVTLDDLADTVVAQIDELDGDVVIAGHSGGGIVATEVGERIPHRVAGIAYVAGMMLPSQLGYVGLCEQMGLTAPPGVGPYLTGIDTCFGPATAVPPEVATAIFFQLAGPDAAITAARRLGVQLESARRIAPVWTAERYGRIPTLYIEATQDRSLPLHIQRQMQALVPPTATVTLDCDHAPQLSSPTELAQTLIAFCETEARGSHIHGVPGGNPSDK
ncbi:alpha/beta fold hydrolase [Gordonia sp. NPDC003376]